MKTNSQKIIWSELVENVDVGSVVKSYKNPIGFQRDLSEYINKNFRNVKKVIEMGASTGVTSALLNKRFEITLLDFDEKSIEIAKKFYRKIKRKCKFIVSDMFEVPAPDNTFDLAYSAGVLEHYNFKERQRAILEMARIVKLNGYLIIAIPNHYSLPYRISYLLRKKMNRWMYPDEYKIYDFQNEIRGIEFLKQEKRFTMTHNTIFAFLPTKILRGTFYLLNKVFPFESYLTVVVLKKTKKSSRKI